MAQTCHHYAMTDLARVGQGVRLVSTTDQPAGRFPREVEAVIDRDDWPCQITARVVIRNERPRLVGLSVAAKSEANPVDLDEALALMRKRGPLSLWALWLFSMGFAKTFTRQAMGRMADDPEWSSLLSSAEGSEALLEAAATLAMGLMTTTASSLAKEPRKRSLDAGTLEETAQVYKEAERAGRPPVKAVKDRMRVSLRTATRRVAAARTAGLLPRPTHDSPEE